MKSEPIYHCYRYSLHIHTLWMISFCISSCYNFRTVRVIKIYSSRVAVLVSSDCIQMFCSNHLSRFFLNELGNGNLLETLILCHKIHQYFTVNGMNLPSFHFIKFPPAVLPLGITSRRAGLQQSTASLVFGASIWPQTYAGIWYHVYQLV